MKRGAALIAVLCTALIAGCSSLPGLRVLSGEPEVGTEGADLTVQALDLVVADKSGSVDPALAAAADRIEAANGSIDIIEVRRDDDLRMFNVALIFSPPQADTSTQAGQVAQTEALRRAFETTWLGMMRLSEGADVLTVSIIQTVQFPTMDSGESTIGFVTSQSRIDRADAAAYLQGDRNLTTFGDLVVTGALDYQRFSDPQIYAGTPNHPLFMAGG